MSTGKQTAPLSIIIKKQPFACHSLKDRHDFITRQSAAVRLRNKVGLRTQKQRPSSLFTQCWGRTKRSTRHCCFGLSPTFPDWTSPDCHARHLLPCLSFWAPFAVAHMCSSWFGPHLHWTLEEVGRLAGKERVCSKKAERLQFFTLSTTLGRPTTKFGRDDQHHLRCDFSPSLLSASQRHTAVIVRGLQSEADRCPHGLVKADFRTKSNKPWMFLELLLFRKGRRGSTRVLTNAMFLSNNCLPFETQLFEV